MDVEDYSQAAKQIIEEIPTKENEEEIRAKER